MITNAAGEKVPKHFGYGTAGFRTLGTHLEKVLFRVGILMALKAKLTTRAALMVTASHNAAPDNGVKIIECDGSMLDQAWEPLAEGLANCADLRTFLEELDNSPDKHKYGLQESIFCKTTFAEACFAMDTRVTSPALVKAAMTSCEMMGVTCTDFGFCTTPQLHWLISQNKTKKMDHGLYISHLREVFMAFMVLADGPEKKNYQKDMILDGANGIGAVIMKEWLG